MSAESYARLVTVPAHLDSGVADTEPGGCPFCIARVGGSDSRFDDVLAAGPRASVVPALGMLVPGYLLAVTNDHVLSFADLGREALLSHVRWMGDLLGDLAAEFGDYLVIEHGSCSGTPSGACIDHAHAHLIPLARELRDAILGNVAWERLARYSDLANCMNLGYTYFGVGSEHYVTRARLPSQWIRRIVAAHLGHDRWDWAIDAGLGNLDDTLDRIKILRERSIDWIASA